MKRPNRGWVTFLLAGVLGATGGTASAEAPTSGTASAEAPTSGTASAEAPASGASVPANSASTPASSASTPEPAVPAERKFTPDKLSFFISGGVDDSLFWSFGVTLPAGVTLSIGASIEYNGNGLTSPGATMPSSDKFAFTGRFYGAYYIYNKFPMGVVAETMVTEPLSPTAGNPAIVIQPGFGVYYSPFPAPIAIGSGLNVAVTIPKTGSTVVSTVTPGLRIAWIF